MGSRSYNYHNPNAQPNSSMSGPHSRGSDGPYRAPGHPSPAHGSQGGSLQPDSPYLPRSGPHSQGSNGSYSASGNLPLQAHGLQSGYLPPESPYLSGPSRGGHSFPDDGTGRYYSPPGYPGSQSGHPHPGDDTGRQYPPRHTSQNTASHQVGIPKHGSSQSGPPQNTVSHQVFVPRHGSSQSGPPQYAVSNHVAIPRQDLPPSTSYNLNTAHGLAQSRPPRDDDKRRDSPPRYLTSPANDPSQSRPLPPDPPPGGGTRRDSGLLSMVRYVNEFFL